MELLAHGLGQGEHVPGPLRCSLGDPGALLGELEFSYAAGGDLVSDPLLRAAVGRVEVGIVERVDASTVLVEVTRLVRTPVVAVLARPDEDLFFPLRGSKSECSSGRAQAGPVPNIFHRGIRAGEVV